MTKGRGEASAPHANEADPAEGKRSQKHNKTIFRIFNPKNNGIKPLFCYFCHTITRGDYMAIIEQLIYILARTTLS